MRFWGCMLNGLSIRKCRSGLNNHGLPNNPNIPITPKFLIIEE